MTSTIEQAHHVEHSGLRITLHARPAINLALVHNGVPLVTAIEVVNVSDHAMTDLTATLHLQRGDTDLAPSTSRTYDGDVAPNALVIWDGFGDFLPAVDDLKELNESYRATLTLTVDSVWTSPAQLTIPITVLAHNEWFNAPLYYDSIAAFVQPNTKAVSSVLDKASTILLDSTGDASLAGYQNGPERAATIAAAIYEALHSQSIRYIEPPASFEDSGQKVRTTSQVLEERFGTCIDLSVAYAACLEAAGIRPLVWLVRGHALAGFLREERTLNRPSLTEQNAMVNLVESGLAIPIDAIYYRPGADGAFKAAASSGRSYFAAPEQMRGVIDITAARKGGLRPLPSVEEVTPVHEPGPAAPTTNLELPIDLMESTNRDDVVIDAHDTAPARVRKWKRGLLDLSTRNRLLNLRASREVIDLHVPSGGLALLDDLAHDGKTIVLTANDELSSIHQLQGARRAAEIDPTQLLQYLRDDHNVYAAVSQASYTRTFKELARKAKTMLEETGGANLYLTMGALIHHTSSNAEARAPLFLLPIRITGGTGRSPYSFVVDTTGIATPNHCLVQWLKIKHKVTIPSLDNPPRDDSGIDIKSALRSIRAGLVEYNLNFRIDEVATLSICQFGTFGMWKDLQDHWDILEQSPIVRHLTHNPGESFRDPAAGTHECSLDSSPLDEADLPVPIPADGSQLRAIALAAEGRTFVLEGPPGTGKSQTITNLIAHALSVGKSVLFVAQKQAALDVVKKRLTAVGLADFALDLHGNSQDPKAIRAQLSKAIDNRTVYNDMAWTARFAEYQARLAPLVDYPTRIHQRNAADESLWRAYESLLTIGFDGPVAAVPNSFVARPGTPPSAIADALRQFSRAALNLPVAPASPWSLAGPEEALSSDEIATTFADLATSLAQVRGTAAIALLEHLPEPLRAGALVPQARRQIGRPVPDAATLQWWRSTEFQARRTALLQEIEQLQRNCAPVLAAFSPKFVESVDVTTFIQQAEEATKGMFGKKKRAEALTQSLTPYVAGDSILTPEAILPLLRAVPSARMQMEGVTTRLRETLGPWAPPYWNPLDPQAAESVKARFEYIDSTAEFARSEHDLWELLTTNGFPDDAAVAALDALSTSWHDWLRSLKTQPDDFRRWTQGRHWLAAWQADEPAWLSDINDAGGRTFLAWSRMSAFLNPLRASQLNEYVSQLLTGTVSASDATTAFIRGAAQTSIRERRSSAGITSFDTALRDGEIDDFARAASSLRTELTKALPARLLARRPFQAGALKGDVGELRGLLERKRGAVTFRNLMSKYGEHIQAATPVMFVSPVSLAKFIPPGSVTFDLVVFDEASQVPVPEAIGALGRGRVAVIAGDSQQMPPTSVGKVSLDDEDEADESGEVAPDDLESILSECVESGVPRLWLSWHYRSQDESLITFSNRKYYGGKLASLPSPGGDTSTGVEWRRVEGQFDRSAKGSAFRTNRVEAEAIVSEIRTRLATPHLAGQSIGVVTFNQQQQALVQDLLEASGDPLVLEQLRPDANEGIFVKNLENVQGDERDVILFTTAFSKNPGETRLPLNFGPLGNTGGEKRFNVAITRARRKVLIFTSFDPSDIDLSRTRSLGLSHLRAYLEMASNGVQPTTASAETKSVADPIQQSIKTALEIRGYVVETDFGLSDFVMDLVVREPSSEQWQVAIMLDGPRWAERPTVADRDITPLLLQPMMHWGAMVRIWLPEWIDSPSNVLQRVDDAIVTARKNHEDHLAQLAEEAAAQAELIAEAQARDSDGGAAQDVDETSEVEAPRVGAETTWTATPVTDDAPVAVAAVGIDEPVSLTTLTARSDWDGCPAQYHPAPTTSLGPREQLDRENSSSVRSQITEAIRETVTAEGPIELDRLARSIGRRYGYDRLRANRKAFILGCVPAALVMKSELGDFAWPSELNPQTWRGYRSAPSEGSRPLSEVAPQEIVNAMASACTARALDDEPLMRETMASFGQSRLTAQTSDRLRACIDLGIQSGRLLRIDGALRSGL